MTRNQRKTIAAAAKGLALYVRPRKAKRQRRRARKA